MREGFDETYARAKAEGRREAFAEAAEWCRVECDALREAALSVASEVRGDHHLASSAYELMEDAIAALAQSAVSGKWSERDRDPRWHTIFDKEDTQ